MPSTRFCLTVSVGEDVAILWNVSQPEVSDFKTLLSCYLIPLELDRTLRLDFTHYGFDSRGTADTVTPEQANDLALGNVKIDALQYVALAVEGMKGQ